MGRHERAGDAGRDRSRGIGAGASQDGREAEEADLLACCPEEAAEAVARGIMAEGLLEWLAREEA